MKQNWFVLVVSLLAFHFVVHPFFSGFFARMHCNRFPANTVEVANSTFDKVTIHCSELLRY